MDEDTTDALLIQDTGTLFIGADVLINHTIDSSQPISFGTITTNDSSYTITQNADIGSTNAIDALNIGDSDTWDAHGDIITNATGADISLGVASAGTVLNLYGGITITADLEGNAGDTVNILAGDDTVTYNGAMASVILDVQTGTLHATERIGGVTGLASITVADGATLTLDDGAQTLGILDIDGTVNISSQNSLDANTYTGSDGDSGAIVLGIRQTSGTTLNGSVNITAGGAVDYSNDTLSLVFENGTDVLPEGTTVVSDILTGPAGSMLLPTVVDTSFLYDYSLSNSGTNADLTITRGSIADLTNNAQNATSAGILLDTLFDTDDDVLHDIQYNLANTSTREDFNNILESTQPSLDAGVFTAVSYVNNQTRHLIQNRLHTLQTYKKRVEAAKVRQERSYHDGLSSNKPVRSVAEIEPAAGDATASTNGYIVPNRTRELALKRLRYLKRSGKTDEKSLSQGYSLARNRFQAQDKKYKYDDRSYEIWGQSFLGNGRQNERDNIDGYKFDTTGITAGVDVNSENKKIILGSFLTYADTNLSAGNANQTETQVNTYQTGLYGTYLYDDSSFVNGFATMGLNDIASTRFRVGGTSSNAKAEYDAIYMNLGAEYGALYDTGSAWMLTPSFGLYYSRMNFEKYRERGAGGANLIVTMDTMHRLDIGPNLTASAHYALENGLSFIPEMNASYSYNLLQNGITARAYMQGTVQDDDPATAVEVAYDGFDTQDHIFNLGFGANLASDKWKILTRYNYELNEDFAGHLASIKLNYSL